MQKSNKLIALLCIINASVIQGCEGCFDAIFFCFRSPGPDGRANGGNPSPVGEQDHPPAPDAENLADLSCYSCVYDGQEIDVWKTFFDDDGKLKQPKTVKDGKPGECLLVNYKGSPTVILADGSKKTLDSSFIFADHPEENANHWAVVLAEDVLIRNQTLGLGAGSLSNLPMFRPGVKEMGIMPIMGISSPHNRRMLRFDKEGTPFLLVNNNVFNKTVECPVKIQSDIDVSDLFKGLAGTPIQTVSDFGDQTVGKYDSTYVKLIKLGDKYFMIHKDLSVALLASEESEMDTNLSADELKSCGINPPGFPPAEPPMSPRSESGGINKEIPIDQIADSEHHLEVKKKDQEPEETIQSKYTLGDYGKLGIGLGNANIETYEDSLVDCFNEEYAKDNLKLVLQILSKRSDDLLEEAGSSFYPPQLLDGIFQKLSDCVQEIRSAESVTPNLGKKLMICLHMANRLDGFLLFRLDVLKQIFNKVLGGYDWKTVHNKDELLDNLKQSKNIQSFIEAWEKLNAAAGKDEKWKSLVQQHINKELEPRQGLSDLTNVENLKSELNRYLEIKWGQGQYYKGKDGEKAIPDLIADLDKNFKTEAVLPPAPRGDGSQQFGAHRRTASLDGHEIGLPLPPIDPRLDDGWSAARDDRAIAAQGESEPSARREWLAPNANPNGAVLMPAPRRSLESEVWLPRQEGSSLPALTREALTGRLQGTWSTEEEGDGLEGLDQSPSGYYSRLGDMPAQMHVQRRPQSPLLADSGNGWLDEYRAVVLRRPGVRAQQQSFNAWAHASPPGGDLLRTQVWIQGDSSLPSGGDSPWASVPRRYQADSIEGQDDSNGNAGAPSRPAPRFWEEKSYAWAHPGPQEGDLFRASVGEAPTGLLSGLPRWDSPGRQDSDGSGSPARIGSVLKSEPSREAPAGFYRELLELQGGDRGQSSRPSSHLGLRPLPPVPQRSSPPRLTLEQYDLGDCQDLYFEDESLRQAITEYQNKVNPKGGLFDPVDHETAQNELRTLSSALLEKAEQVIEKNNFSQESIQAIKIQWVDEIFGSLRSSVNEVEVEGENVTVGSVKKLMRSLSKALKLDKRLQDKLQEFNLIGNDCNIESKDKVSDLFKAAEGNDRLITLLCVKMSLIHQYFHPNQRYSGLRVVAPDHSKVIEELRAYKQVFTIAAIHPEVKSVVEEYCDAISGINVGDTEDVDQSSLDLAKASLDAMIEAFCKYARDLYNANKEIPGILELLPELKEFNFKISCKNRNQFEKLVLKCDIVASAIKKLDSKAAEMLDHFAQALESIRERNDATTAFNITKRTKQGIRDLPQCFAILETAMNVANKDSKKLLELTNNMLSAFGCSEAIVKKLQNSEYNDSIRDQIIEDYIKSKLNEWVTLDSVVKARARLQELQRQP